MRYHSVLPTLAKCITVRVPETLVVLLWAGGTSRGCRKLRPKVACPARAKNDKSVLLRTWPTSPSTYRYFIHPIEDMKQWMQRSSVYDARTMLRYIKRHRRTDLFTVYSYPEFAVASEKRARRRRRKR